MSFEVDSAGEEADGVIITTPEGPITLSVTASVTVLEIAPTIACTPSISTRRRASSTPCVGFHFRVARDEHDVAAVHAAGLVDVLHRKLHADADHVPQLSERAGAIGEVADPQLLALVLAIATARGGDRGASDEQQEEQSGGQAAHAASLRRSRNACPGSVLQGV